MKLHQVTKKSTAAATRIWQTHEAGAEHRARRYIGVWAPRLGPYTEMAMYLGQSVWINFRHNGRFLNVRCGNREVRVTHCGNISVKEKFEVRNGVVCHRGKWSRLDHSNLYESPYLMSISNVGESSTLCYGCGLPLPDWKGYMSRVCRETREKCDVQVILR